MLQSMLNRSPSNVEQWLIFIQAYLHAHMRHKTNEFLKRLQLARPEVKKSFRRGATNAGGQLSRYSAQLLILICPTFLADGSAGVE